MNTARARNNAARYLDITEMTKDTVVDFSAMMSVAILKRSHRPTRYVWTDQTQQEHTEQKRAFFMLCAGSIVDEINSFDARNAIVVFLSSDGKRHQSIFDADGSLTYTVTQREVGYGEADLSVPLEMAAIGPDVPWELWTIGMVNPHVPV